jgi:hypothetical protein
VGCTQEGVIRKLKEVKQRREERHQALLFPPYLMYLSFNLTKPYEAKPHTAL